MIMNVSHDSYNAQPDCFKRLVSPSNQLMPFYLMLTFIDPPHHGLHRMYKLIKTMLLSPYTLFGCTNCGLKRFDSSVAVHEKGGCILKGG